MIIDQGEKSNSYHALIGDDVGSQEQTRVDVAGGF